MQSETGFPSSHQLKSYVASKSRLKLAARAVLSADAGLLVYIMKLCSRLFVLYCRNCPKDDKFRYFIPNLRKLGAGRTLVDGSLESPCRVLVKCNWTSFSISYG